MATNKAIASAMKASSIEAKTELKDHKKSSILLFSFSFFTKCTKDNDFSLHTSLALQQAVSASDIRVVNPAVAVDRVTFQLCSLRQSMTYESAGLQEVLRPRKQIFIYVMGNSPTQTRSGGFVHHALNCVLQSNLC